MRSPLSLPFSRLNKPSSFKPSLWTLSKCSISLLCWGPHAGTQYSSLGPHEGTVEGDNHFLTFSERNQEALRKRIKVANSLPCFNQVVLYWSNASFSKLGPSDAHRSENQKIFTVSKNEFKWVHTGSENLWKYYNILASKMTVYMKANFCCFLRLFPNSCVKKWRRIAYETQLA